MFIMVSIVILVTTIFNQILSSGVIITFVWVVMMMLPASLYRLNHNIANFLPYNMTNFNKYYLNNEMYSLFGDDFLALGYISLVGIVVCISLIIISNVILQRKIKKFERKLGKV